jgi:mono/diheme cytochrome c family protein
MGQRSVRIVGNLLVVVALILGLVGAGLLYQWERGLEASPPQEASLSSGRPPAVSASLPKSPPGTQPETSATGQPPQQAQGSPSANPTSGKTIYQSLCNGCHPNGKAGVGPALIGLDEKTIVQTVRQGKGGMPPFPTDRVSDAQLSDIIAYVETLK